METEQQRQLRLDAYNLTHTYEYANTDRAIPPPAASTFPRKDATALEAALGQLAVTVRYNLRAMCPEKRSSSGGEWEKTTDRSSADLRRMIADRFSYRLAAGGLAPLSYGTDSWFEHLNALLYDTWRSTPSRRG